MNDNIELEEIVEFEEIDELEEIEELDEEFTGDVPIMLLAENTSSDLSTIESLIQYNNDKLDSFLDAYPIITTVNVPIPNYTQLRGFIFNVSEQGAKLIANEYASCYYLQLPTGDYHFTFTGRISCAVTPLYKGSSSTFTYRAYQSSVNDGTIEYDWHIESTDYIFFTGMNNNITITTTQTEYINYTLSELGSAVVGLSDNIVELQEVVSSYQDVCSDMQRQYDNMTILLFILAFVPILTSTMHKLFFRKE